MARNVKTGGGELPRDSCGTLDRRKAGAVERGCVKRSHRYGTTTAANEPQESRVKQAPIGEGQNLGTCQAHSQGFLPLWYKPAQSITWYVTTTHQCTTLDAHVCCFTTIFSGLRCGAANSPFTKNSLLLRDTRAVYDIHSGTPDIISGRDTAHRVRQRSMTYTDASYRAGWLRWTTCLWHMVCWHHAVLHTHLALSPPRHLSLPTQAVDILGWLPAHTITSETRTSCIAALARVAIVHWQFSVAAKTCTMIQNR